MEGACFIRRGHAAPRRGSAAGPLRMRDTARRPSPARRRRRPTPAAACARGPLAAAWSRRSSLPACFGLDPPLCSSPPASPPLLMDSLARCVTPWCAAAVDRPAAGAADRGRRHPPRARRSRPLPTATALARSALRQGRAARRRGLKAPGGIGRQTADGRGALVWIPPTRSTDPCLALGRGPRGSTQAGSRAAAYVTLWHRPAAEVAVRFQPRWSFVMHRLSQPTRVVK